MLNNHEPVIVTINFYVTIYTFNRKTSMIQEVVYLLENYNLQQTSD
jgi:hypothetical protein